MMNVTHGTATQIQKHGTNNAQSDMTVLGPDALYCMHHNRALIIQSKADTLLKRFFSRDKGWCTGAWPGTRYELS